MIQLSTCFVNIYFVVNRYVCFAVTHYTMLRTEQHHAVHGLRLQLPERQHMVQEPRQDHQLRQPGCMCVHACVHIVVL
jgi:hypothetical protein